MTQKGPGEGRQTRPPVLIAEKGNHVEDKRGLEVVTRP